MGGVGSGRRARPTHLKALEGVGESRLNRDEPVPSEAPIRPPSALPTDAQAIWDRLAPDLIARRVLTAWDVDLFAAFCRELSLYYRAAAEVESNGAHVERPRSGPVPSPAFRVMQACLDSVRSLAASFGLTPADRARLSIEPATGGQTVGAARLLDS